MLSANYEVVEREINDIKSKTCCLNPHPLPNMGQSSYGEGVFITSECCLEARQTGFSLWSNQMPENRHSSGSMDCSAHRT